MERTGETTPTPGPGDADRVDAPGGDDAPSPLGAPDEDSKPVEDPSPGDAVGAVSSGSAAATRSAATGAGSATPDSTPPAPAPVTPTPIPSLAGTGAPAGHEPPVAPEATAQTASVTEERPELLLLGAFAAGLLLAIVIKRLGR